MNRPRAIWVVIYIQLFCVKSPTEAYSSLSDEDDISGSSYDNNEYRHPSRRLAYSLCSDAESASSSEYRIKYSKSGHYQTYPRPEKRRPKRAKRKFDDSLDYSAQSFFLESEENSFDEDLRSTKRSKSVSNQKYESEGVTKSSQPPLKKRTKSKKRRKKPTKELPKTPRNNAEQSMKNKKVVISQELPSVRSKISGKDKVDSSDIKKENIQEKMSAMNAGPSQDSAVNSIKKENIQENMSAMNAGPSQDSAVNSLERKSPYEYGSASNHQRNIQAKQLYHPQKYSQHQKQPHPNKYPTSPIHSNVPSPTPPQQSQVVVPQAKSSSTTTSPSPKTSSKKKPSPTTIPSATSGATTLWIRDYLSSHRRDHLLPVPRDFIVDGFNLQKLQDIVESHAPPSSPPGIFKAALRLILDQKPQSQRFMASSATSITTKSNSSMPAPVSNTKSLLSSTAAPGTKKSKTSTTSTKSNEHLFSEEVRTVASEILYPLLHSRFILSPRGLLAVSRAMKQSGAVFGRCPRQFCKGQPLLPCGMSDCDVGRGKCMRYCCSCGEVLYMWDSSVDGCAWGSSFCHLLLMVFGKDLFPALSMLSAETTSTTPNTTPLLQSTSTPSTSNPNSNETSNSETPLTVSTPSIFGFRVHPTDAPVRYPVSKRVLSYHQLKSYGQRKGAL